MDAAVELLKKDIAGKDGVTVSGEVVDIKNFKSLTEFLTKEAPFDHLVSGLLLPGPICGVLNLLGLGDYCW